LGYRGFFLQDSPSRTFLRAFKISRGKAGPANQMAR
jgi:hypothetical protein